MENNETSVSQLEQEYSSLRQEMFNATALSNQFSTFSITTMAAILAFAISQENALLFLFPFLVIIPLSSKSLYYRKNVAKTAAYIITNLEPRIEGYNWETKNAQYKEDASTGKYTLFRNYEYLFEGAVCLVLFIYFAIRSSLPTAELVAGGIFGIIAFIYVSLISYKIAHTRALRDQSVEKWNAIEESAE